MSLLQKAIRDRYVIFDKKKNNITYLPHVRVRSLDYPEEKIQLNTFLKLIYNYDYPPEKIKVCVPIKMGSSNKEADIIVYADEDCKSPYILIECKKAGISQGDFTEAIEQGFSYAAALNANFVWATSGRKNAFFEVWEDIIGEREENQLEDIPANDEEIKRKSWLQKKLSLRRNPILADTLLYTIILSILMLIVSKFFIYYFNDIYKATRNLWDTGKLNMFWIYNLVVGLSVLISLLFGRIFMRSHRLFAISAIKTKIGFILIAAILFVPAWYMGVSNRNPDWWELDFFQSRKFPSKIFLWPYLKALPFQFFATYGMIWLIGKKG